ncbi:MAG: EAL domain-containing protein [Pegethrix bostrychoides GSE-TBD4-15B]|jgi:diguanylate cyclase (GGDEF)-like protein/PAS domain S-box-containing protein|uniref:EAL domain-containing protein n=1 Tax=Pegethrix bostrychoides GSE-TBD4-15B TaxID=2839662 RepID=A0A951PFA3_9CYAN|nr:EAL domain-containing protein [Pegethrix bostrychoides GSE-TBD4-15B]
MNLKKRRTGFSLSALPLLLIGCGWSTVVAQSQSLETATIQTYQAAQLEVTRSAARAARIYVNRASQQRGRPDDPNAAAAPLTEQVEQEILNNFIKPIQTVGSGRVWVYSPTAVVFDQSPDFPAEYQGKSLALIFAIQRQHGAGHYEEMTQAVMQGREGKGWYIWNPQRARDSAPWWEPLTRDSGHEIAVWSPVTLSDTPHSQVWVIGVSAMLPELMRANGAYDQIQNSIFAMSIMTGVALGLMALLRRNRNALKASESHYRAIVEDQMEMICRFRYDGSLTFANQAYADAFGFQAENFKQMNLFDLVPQSELPALLSQISTLSAAHPVQFSERLTATADQQQRWQQWTDRAILSPRGQVVEIQSVGRDITSRKLYESEIERLAFTDPLTGLANRRRLYAVGQETLSTQRLDQMGLIYLDLDRFKPINDMLGHDAGDELLVQVADRLQACIRRADTLARLGGDEFAILLVSSDLTEAEQVADRILIALHQPFHLCGQAIQIGTSLGIAITTSAEMPFSQLLTQADIAMYRAKSRGRGNYVIFDGAMYAEILTKRELETDLRQVIERQQLRVYYQPIVALASGQLWGLEAVVRWHHPKRGLLAPAQFLQMAEDVGCSLPIERWVVRQACHQIAQWRQFYPDLRLSLNLSGKHLAQPDGVDYLETLLQETGLSPHQIMLEITETIVLEQTDLATAALARLRQMGVRIALDDFGTGYSSLSYLHHFPVDVLKIDRTFVRALKPSASSGQHSAAPEDSKNSEIVRSIVRLAQSLNIATVAEGIETAEQLAQLRALDCQAGQGYFFAEPLNQFALEDFLKRQKHERLKLTH